MTIALSTMKKKELLNFLETANQGKLEDDLQAKVENVLTDPPNKSEVYELAQTVKTQVDDLTPIENSLKKAPKKKESKDDSKPKKKKKVKKKSKKKSKKKKLSAVKVQHDSYTFEPEFEVEGLGTVKATHDIETIEDFKEAFESDQSIVIGTLWTPKQLKKYNYDQVGIATDIPEKFEQDMDILQPVHVSENAVFAVSLYTEVLFIFKAENFEINDDGVRFENGMEWDVFEIE